jgi:hypothetical protein
MLLPGTFGRTCSKTSVVFASLSAAIAGRMAIAVAMAVQKMTAQVKCGSLAGWIRFIAMFFLKTIS